MDYLTENYIDSEAKFPISVRAETTSFHSKYNSLCCTHRPPPPPHSPDIYTFLDILKKIRTATETTGKRKGSTHTKILHLSKKILTNIELTKYLDGILSK